MAQAVNQECQCYIMHSEHCIQMAIDMAVLVYVPVRVMATNISRPRFREGTDTCPKNPTYVCCVITLMMYYSS